MTQQQAKQKLFEALDAAFRKYGAAAGMSNPGFHPHYSEVGAEDMRPTWYTKFQIDENTILYTTYESVEDLCISVLFERDKEPRAGMHTGYPKSLDEAKKILKLFNNPDK